MLNRTLRTGERITDFWAGLRSAKTAACDNWLLRALRNVKRSLHGRWQAVCFTRRFYGQACRSSETVSSKESACEQDFTESLLQRSLPQELHALVHLRVASQIASITETAARTEACQRRGWSDMQIRAAILGNLGESFSESELLALRYADEMTRTPIDVDPQTLKQLRKYFTQSDLTELTASIAHENFRCRFTDANSRVR